MVALSQTTIVFYDNGWNKYAFYRPPEFAKRWHPVLFAGNSIGSLVDEMKRMSWLFGSYCVLNKKPEIWDKTDFRALYKNEMIDFQARAKGIDSIFFL